MVLRIECRMRSLLTTRALILQVLEKATLTQRIHAPLLLSLPPLPLLPLQQVLSRQRDHQYSKVRMTDNQTGTTHLPLPVIENMTTGEVAAVRRLGPIILNERAIVVESSQSRTQIAADLLEGVEVAALSQGLLEMTIEITIGTGIGMMIEEETEIAIRIGIGTGVETGIAAEIGTEIAIRIGIGIGVETGIRIRVETGIGIGREHE
jgi:hypothetical protein